MNKRCPVCKSDDLSVITDDGDGTGRVMLTRMWCRACGEYSPCVNSIQLAADEAYLRWRCVHWCPDEEEAKP